MSQFTTEDTLRNQALICLTMCNLTRNEENIYFVSNSYDINGLTPPTADPLNKRREYNSSPQQHKDHKIIIIGDSHARGAASNVQHNLDTTFGSNGFVSAGANMSSLTSSI